GVRRPFRARRSRRWRGDARVNQHLRNPDHDRRGLADFVVQACRRQERAAQRRRRQCRSGRRKSMRPRSLLLVLVCLAGTLAAQPLRAEDALQSCEVPDNLLATESPLTKTGEAIKAGKLDLLVIGSRSSTIVSADSNAYPARLRAALAAALPKLAVNLSVEIQVKKTAEEVDSGLPRLLEGKKPTLVIWQTGTVD